MQIDVALKILPALKACGSNTGFSVSAPLPLPAYKAKTQSPTNPSKMTTCSATEMKFAREVTVIPNQFTPVVAATSNTIQTPRSTPGIRVSSATAIST